MTDQAFLLDLGRCIGCEACVVGCSTGNELVSGQYLIEISQWERGSFPQVAAGFNNHRCYHCTDAACVTVCPTGALFKGDGLTRLDRSVCSGCAYCVEACPFDVPVMIEGLASKCDGCAQTVASGRDPWCVVTCPSRALEYGNRDEILATAERRAADLRSRYPDATVYGKTQAGGLGLLVVTPEDPSVHGLPADPQTATPIGLWQDIVQPAAVGLTAATAVAAGVGAVIARRNHMQELREIEAAEGGEGS
jgi:formate dehydrogenase iron-sulfur subunit